MPVQYPNTPGVKIKEESVLPPSIVQVSTAIPIFLGYTKVGTVKQAVRITSLKEYEEKFGGALKHNFTLSTTTSGGFSMTSPPTTLDFIFYECIQMYFLNGGGPCYIIPVGNYETTTVITDTHFTEAIPIIETLDEPTLIAFPEAVKFDLNAYKGIVTAALTVCNHTKDKFTLIDQSKEVDLLNFNPFTAATTNPVAPAVNPNGAEEFRTSLGIGNLSYGAVYYPSLEISLNFAIDEEVSKVDGDTLEDLKANGSAKYVTAIQTINKNTTVILPPSSLMAGVYAKNDREKGFWHAPANVSLQGVIQPTVAISSSNQENLNVDATSGKSVNAIRQFTGKGTLVWGARTLDGNSNEWRYISVRRLFMTVEESVKKAPSQFVFENNDSKTWVKVNSMISSYLNGLWKQGALMGAKPEEAYFVEIGLGTTMTEQDIFEGRMIVKVGLASVRPAEFIILSFSHLMGQ